MARLPKDIYQDAKIAHKQGDLENAMKLYAESTYFHNAAKVALQLGRPEQARDFYMDAGDTWSAEQVGKKHNIDAPSYKSPVYVKNGTIPQYSDTHDLVTIVSQGEQGITGSSVNIYRAIKSKLETQSNPNVKLNVSEEDVFSNESKSIALDTRTGQKFVYDPKQFADVRVNVPIIDGRIYSARMAYNSFAKRQE